MRKRLRLGREGEREKTEKDQRNLGGKGNVRYCEKKHPDEEKES